MSIEKLYELFLECGRKIATDSRKIAGGEIFIALRGENFDGNDYAFQTLDAGAAYAVVSSDSKAAASDDTRIIPVADTLETLKNLARYHRRTLSCPVLGLTGTNGKTTTKELIRSVLATTFRVSATCGNLNNDIGVPLTLLSIPEDAKMAVVEMGANHPDDIRNLVEVAEPDFGLITNVGKAHLLGFGSFEGVKKAKGQLYDFIAGRSGTVFINSDDSELMQMASERSGLSLVDYGFGKDHAKVLTAMPDKPYLRLRFGRRIIKTKLVGAYNANNILAAIAIGRYFGVDIASAIKAVEAYVPANSRSQMSKTETNTLILDLYNANPSSMKAALDNFSLVESSSKIVLLGDMRELGGESLNEHIRVLKQIESTDLTAYLVGDEFKKAAATLEGIKHIAGFFKSSEDLAGYLNSNPIKESVILVKGSRGIQMEKVIASL